MAQNQAVENSLTWMRDEQKIHDTAEHGSNERAVFEALAEQRRRNTLVKDYNDEAEKATSAAEGDRVKQGIGKAYDELAATSSKRLGCLEDISQIAGLESLFNNLTVEFAQRASTLVSESCGKNDNVNGGKETNGVAKAAQNCILAVRSNWKWISKLVGCTDTHLQHVSDYHQFFHEAKEYEDWMPNDMAKVERRLEALNKEKNDGKDYGNKIVYELKEVLVIFLHWQGKVNELFDRSRNILPINLRTSKLEGYRPVKALCDYKTSQINIREGEELTLTDNSKPQSWTVKNMHFTEAQVPSVVVVIPGPDPKALQVANELRLRLLGYWTSSVKLFGRNIFFYILLVVRDWNEDEAKKLRAIPDEGKKEIIRLLDLIESALSRYWSEYPAFKLMQTRFARTKEILAEKGDDKDRDEEWTKNFIERLNIVGLQLGGYKDLTESWEAYKMIVETCSYGELILMAEKWQDLKWVTLKELREKWFMGLEWNQSELNELETYLRSLKSQEEEIVEEVIDSVDAQQSQASVGGTAMLDVAKETAGTDQFMSAEQEEKRTFIITGVIDPRNGEEVSMQQAVMLGIINSAEGTYVNPDTGDSMPIPVAMNSGQIKVEFTTSKKTAERRKDVGLITIRTQKESRPYTVKGVIDAKTEEKLSLDEAINNGILNQASGTYLNRATETEMSLADALDSGLLVVEFDKDAPHADPETVTKTYAIHAVVNQRAKKRVTFTEAVRSGLIDKETGAYYHNVSKEYIYVGDAIQRGFIKATIVKDPSSMDIDPENKFVVDKVASIRKKLLNPIRAMAALKKAADSPEEHEVQDWELDDFSNNFKSAMETDDANVNDNDTSRENNTLLVIDNSESDTQPSVTDGADHTYSSEMTNDTPIYTEMEESDKLNQNSDTRKTSIHFDNQSTQETLVTKRKVAKVSPLSHDGDISHSTQYDKEDYAVGEDPNDHQSIESKSSDGETMDTENVILTDTTGTDPTVDGTTSQPREPDKDRMLSTNEGLDSGGYMNTDGESKTSEQDLSIVGNNDKDVVDSTVDISKADSSTAIELDSTQDTSQTSMYFGTHSDHNQDTSRATIHSCAHSIGFWDHSSSQIVTADSPVEITQESDILLSKSMTIGGETSVDYTDPHSKQDEFLIGLSKDSENIVSTKDSGKINVPADISKPAKNQSSKKSKGKKGKKSKGKSNAENTQDKSGTIEAETTNESNGIFSTSSTVDVGSLTVQSDDGLKEFDTMSESRTHTTKTSTLKITSSVKSSSGETMISRTTEDTKVKYYDTEESFAGRGFADGQRQAGDGLQLDPSGGAILKKPPKSKVSEDYEFWGISSQGSSNDNEQGTRKIADVLVESTGFIAGGIVDTDGHQNTSGGASSIAQISTDTDSVKLENEDDKTVNSILTRDEADGLLLIGSEKSETETEGGALAAAIAAIQSDAGFENISEEQMTKIQDAMSAILELPLPEDTQSKYSVLCARICKAALPFQILLLLLLGLACLLPMCEEEFSCTLANNFEKSLTILLKYKDGPPPF